MMTFIGMMLPMKVQAADMPANPVDKPGYTLDYADEFNGDSLDKSKWTDYYLPHWSKNPENAKANYRFENGCLVEYITKSLLPVNLNFFYPFPIVLGEEPPLHYYLYPVVLLFLMGWIIDYRNNRYLVFGVLLFLVNLLFSIHLFNMSRHAIVADRYMYLSYVGIAFLIANGIWWLRKRLSYFKAALVFLFFYCFFLSVYTFHYTKKWENTTMVKKYTKEVLEKRLNGSNHL